MKDSKSILASTKDFEKIKDSIKDEYLPQPCAKYLSNTPEAQLKHIAEEVAESWEALCILRQFEMPEEYDAARHKLGEELTDIKCAVETMLQIMSFSPLDRAKLCYEVNEKNRERGYWIVK